MNVIFGHVFKDDAVLVDSLCSTWIQRKYKQNICVERYFHVFISKHVALLNTCIMTILYNFISTNAIVFVMVKQLNVYCTDLSFTILLK